jgi:hypothetical protein
MLYNIKDLNEEEQKEILESFSKDVLINLLIESNKLIDYIVSEQREIINKYEEFSISTS